MKQVNEYLRVCYVDENDNRARLQYIFHLFNAII